mgnify:CR=1 FL=1
MTRAEPSRVGGLSGRRPAAHGQGAAGRASVSTLLQLIRVEYCLLGALGVELLIHKDIREAGKAGIGTWLGLIVGTALKLALVFTMIGIFVIAYAL